MRKWICDACGREVPNNEIVSLVAINCNGAQVEMLGDYCHNCYIEIKESTEKFKDSRKNLPKNAENSFLDYNGKPVARVLKGKDGISVYPIASLQVPIDSKPIGWLKNEPLKSCSEKHGIKFRFEENNGILKAVHLEGEKAELEKLLKPIAWALAKASERANHEDN
ncbi:hypothetical protein J7K27_10290 [Candidatus Bathyarchaeota archaeon]|nr:hypothetical protein [Candidatus Bathyarchaeota archaeon]